MRCVLHHSILQEDFEEEEDLNEEFKTLWPTRGRLMGLCSNIHQGLQKMITVQNERFVSMKKVSKLSQIETKMFHQQSLQVTLIQEKTPELLKTISQGQKCKVISTGAASFFQVATPRELYDYLLNSKKDGSKAIADQIVKDLVRTPADDPSLTNTQEQFLRERKNALFNVLYAYAMYDE